MLPNMKSRVPARQMADVAREQAERRLLAVSSSRKINHSTVTRPGGVRVVGDGSIDSEGDSGVATRLSGGVAEVRETPESEWVPLEQQILEQVPDPSDGEAPTVAPEVTASPFAIGAIEATWPGLRTPEDNADPIVGYEVATSLTSPVPEDGSATQQTALSTKVIISRVGGEPLPRDGSPVFVIVRALDADGPGPWSVERSAAAKSVDFDEISADLRDKVFGAVGDYVVEYAVSSSETVAPTTGWSSGTPSRAPGQFTWIRTRVTYQDDTEVLTSPALLTGNSGAPGAQGVPGTDGTDGAPRYTWIKYGDTPTTGMSDNPAGKAYLGLAYNRTTPTESTNYADYDWSLVKGADGAAGSDGTSGAAGKGISSTAVTYQVGTSGTTAPSGTWQATVQTTSVGQFLWVRTITTYTDATTVTAYAVSAHGATGNTGSAGAPGRGISGTTVTYQVGTSGTTAPTGAWQSGPQATSAGQFHWTRTVTTYTDASTPSTAYAVAAHGNTGQQGIPGSPGADGSPTYTWVKYGTSITGAGLSDDPTGRDYIGLAYNKATPTESTTPGDYQWSLFKGSDGADGAAGAPGVGISGTTVTYQVGTSGTTAPTGTWLSSPAATSPGQFLWTRTVTSYTSGSPTTSYAVSAHGATGTAGSPGTNGEPGAAGKGISSTAVTYQVATSGTTAPTGTWQAGPQATTVGQFHWTRTITTYTDSTTTTAYAVAAHGATGSTGNTGATGVSISSVTPYFQTTASAASAPAAPTTTTPPSPWTSTEPAYAVGTALWRTERIGYSNSTFAYTTVTKVSAFTAASLALTTANGKNTNTSSTTASPATTDRVPGDLHYVLGTGPQAGTYIQIQQLSPGPMFAWVDMPADVATLAGANIGWLNAIIASVDTLLARLVAADEITAEMVAADVMVVNDFFSRESVEVAGASGARMGIYDGVGLAGYDAAGELTTQLDPETGRFSAVRASIKGLAELFSVTVADFLTIQGRRNRLDAGSELQISSGVAAPQQVAVIDRGWPNFATRLESTDPAFQRGLVLNAAGNRWVTITSLAGGRVQTFNLDGSSDSSSYPVIANWAPEGGITRIGANFYALGVGINGGSRNGRWFVKRFSASFVETAEWEWIPTSGFARKPAIGANSDGEVLIAWRTSTQTAVRRLTATTGAVLATFFHNHSGGVDDCVSVNGGVGLTSGVGTNRVIVTHSRSMRVFTPSGVWSPSESWTIAGAAPLAGLAWDGTIFRHIDGAGRMWLYDGPVSSSPVDVDYSWYDADAAGTGVHETNRGPSLTYQRTPRASFVVTTDTPFDSGDPDSPNSVRIWINGNRQPDLGVGVTSAMYGQFFSTGTTSKAPSFLDAGVAAAKIYSEALNGWAGYGEGRFAVRDPLLPTDAVNLRTLDARFTDTTWIAISTSVSGTSRYRVKNGVVYISVDGSLSTTNNTHTVIATGVIPTALRPDANIRYSCYLSGRAGFLSLNPSGDLTVSNFTGSTGGSAAGTIVYPVPLP